MTTATAERRTEAVCLRDPAPCLPRLQWLTPSQIRTSFAALRRGRLGAPRPGDVQAELPLRVFETSDGVYELVDGFKRLERWVGEGATSVPVVIETASEPRQTWKSRASSSSAAGAISVTARARSRLAAGVPNRCVADACQPGIALMCSTRPAAPAAPSAAQAS